MSLGIVCMSEWKLCHLATLGDPEISDDLCLSGGTAGAECPRGNTDLVLFVDFWLHLLFFFFAEMSDLLVAPGGFFPI